MAKEPSFEKNEGQPIELDKRTHLPFTISCECPKCGATLKKDLREQYLSYPVLEEWSDAYIWCPDCDEDALVEVRVIATIEVRKKVDE